MAPLPVFALTPDYDAVLAEWRNANPDHPNPWFSGKEVRALRFHWPETPEPPRPHRVNGRFAKKSR